MLSTKELKEKYGKIFQKKPKKNYPVKSMEKLGFTRGQCKNCDKFFWSLDNRDLCGDAKCIGGYKFIGNTPANNNFSYTGMWKRFLKILSSRGYKEIDRYPVVARWRDDIEFVEASIDDFIPYVVNGISPPPANPLIVPQPCLRFNDLENVGITGSHYTSFIMVGQHSFETPKNYNPDKYLLDLFEWFNKGLGLKNKDIILHEDIWAGSGNFGPCVEFFSSGLELANQVYMQYKQTEKGYTDLDLNVLDMGLGYERNIWFSQGEITSYESSYPSVIEKLKKTTGLSSKPIKDFMKYSSFLDVNETEDREGEWKRIADKIGIDVKELKAKVIPLSKLYSIADHSRALLFGINDGSLPSNIGGGYNLRVMLRRALRFVQEEGWDIDLGEICEEHARYLKPLYPELIKNIEDLKEILEVEKQRFKKTRKKAKRIASEIVKTGEVTQEKIIELYESQGVKPEFIIKEARKYEKDIEIPDIESILSEKQRKEIKEKEKTLEGKYPETEKLYYSKEKQKSFEAKVLGIEDKWVVLDKTLFYPKSGGQDYDKGTLNGKDVIEVKKFGNVIAHKTKGKFKKGEKVKGKIDWKRRKQLTVHHTAIHVLTAAAKKILGNHVHQAGADKKVEKAHLDITHYEALNSKTLKKIEELCSEYIKKDLKIEKKIMSRVEAEKKYGMGIYHGGAVPGKDLRIVKINGIDIEACGGTHLDRTSEIDEIIILGSERIQDGIVRVTIVAGEKAKKYKKKMSRLVDEIQEILEVDKEKVVEETKKVLKKWKKLRKKLKKIKESKGEEIAEELKNKLKNGVLIEKIQGDSDLLKEVSKILTKKGRLLILFGENRKVNVLISSERKENAGELIKEICKKLGGKGGGSKTLAQGIGNKEKLNKVINELRDKYGE